MTETHLTDQVSSISARLHDLEVQAGARNELLIRIDERTKSMATVLETLNTNYVKKEEFAELKKNTVNVETFKPVKIMVYATAGTMLLAVLKYLLDFNK